MSKNNPNQNKSIEFENNCVKCEFNYCAKAYLSAMEGMTETGIGCDTFKLVNL